MKRLLRSHARQLVALLIALLSGSLIVAGIALIYLPLALIVAGVFMAGLLLIDLDTPRRARRWQR